MGVKPLEDADILRFYRPASKRLLLFDYDGTLTDIVQDPSQALLGEPVLEVIQELASNPKNHVWIISGRDRDFLGKEFGHMRLGLVAEHGAFMRYPGSKDWLNKCESADMNWKEHVESKMMDYVGTAPGSFIERKAAALVYLKEKFWFSDYGMSTDKLRKSLEKTIPIRWPVDITSGKCIVEARLRFIHKGQIVRQLAQEIKPDFELCAGDDLTDEDMFRALHASDMPQTNVFTVIVGGHGSDTYAQWCLTEPVDVIGNVFMLQQADRSGGVEGKGALLNNGKPRGSKWLPVSRSALIRANP
ncbi:hypothetical protein OEA41_006589 [Lepraria neglecta]|uniref:Trehalose 6-phosphate phosphatase n=1 Tax=Lepraria neglecta TaxID=209136 RepID=A0AAE0DL31_9LECA|nr:hypothetical protein OEA41_006589 [Lepraria neglecta]